MSIFFFFNDTATTEIYTLSLHDALPISKHSAHHRWPAARGVPVPRPRHARHHRPQRRRCPRSEEHTSELQSPDHLVCRLLLEKKKHNVNEKLAHLDTSGCHRQTEEHLTR